MARITRGEGLYLKQNLPLHTNSTDPRLVSERSPYYTLHICVSQFIQKSYLNESLCNLGASLRVNQSPTVYLLYWQKSVWCWEDKLTVFWPYPSCSISRPLTPFGISLVTAAHRFSSQFEGLALITASCVSICKLESYKQIDSPSKRRPLQTSRLSLQA